MCQGYIPEYLDQKNLRVSNTENLYIFSSFMELIDFKVYKVLIWYISFFFFFGNNIF